jgi:serine/threonine protein kinase/Tol biopolymer transport system component
MHSESFLGHFRVIANICFLAHHLYPCRYSGQWTVVKRVRRSRLLRCCLGLVLGARIRRRSEVHVPALDRPPRLARFNSFELDLQTGELRQSGGEPIRLRDQSFQILLALLARPGEVVLREELRKRLWPNDTVVEFEHSISAAMNKLRQALGDSADKPRFVETFARRGYRWITSVEWFEGASGNSLAASGTIAIEHGIRQGLIGKKVSHYRILEVLGGGGMGVVYKAEDLKLGRCVALKFLGEELIGDHRALERFEREARIISALDHANICAIHEIEEHEGQPFLVMQLLQGQTLRQRIESASRGEIALTLSELLDFGIQILTGLEAAHQKGILHRDVKPANIFITSRGEIKLIDFGLAKLTDAGGTPNEAASPVVEAGAKDVSIGRPSQTSMTLTGAMMGTASYMSPEQMRKEKLDARSDLFGFGVVLYEMATGHQPFRGDDLQEIHNAVLNNTPPSPLVWNPGLPADLEAIVGRALEKDPEKRYQSAGEIISELKRMQRAASERVAADQDAAQASVVTAQSRKRSWSKLASAGVAGLALLVAAGFLARRWTTQHRGLHPQSMEIARLTDSGKAEEVAISPDGRYVAYAQREAHGIALRVRQLVTGSDVQVLPSDAIRFEGLTFSPDGNHLYFVRPDNSDPGFKYLYVMPVLGGEAQRLVTDIDSPISFSPDGQHFVYTRGIPSHNATEIRIANNDGAGNRLLATMTDTFAGFQPGATWSPDGQTIAVPLMRFRKQPRFVLYAVGVADASAHELHSSPYPIGRAVWLRVDSLLSVLKDREDRGQLWTISFPRGNVERLTNDLTNYEERTDLTGNAATLAAIQSTLVSNVWSVPGADALKATQIISLSLPLYEVTEAPNGRLLANSTDGKLWAFSADGKQRSLFTELSNVGAPAVCGNFVVLNSYMNGTSEMMRFDAGGSNPVRLTTGDFSRPVCSPDGRDAFYVEVGPPQKIWRIPLSGGTPVEIATVLGENVVGPIRISPDGKLLAYPYEEYTTLKVKLALIPANGGPVVRILDAPGGVYESGSFRWSPGGRNVQYTLTQNGASNIWEQPLKGGPPHQLTKFNSGVIFDFSWSADGKRLLLCRGEVSSDVVLLTNFR